MLIDHFPSPIFKPLDGINLPLFTSRVWLEYRCPVLLKAGQIVNLSSKANLILSEDPNLVVVSSGLLIK